jgi:hypothetical protein
VQGDALTSDSQQKKGGTNSLTERQKNKKKKKKKEVSECVLHIGVNLWSQNKKSPIIILLAALITHHIQTTSTQVMALCGLTWHFMQTNTCSESSHIN